MGGLQLVLSTTNRIGDTKYIISVGILLSISVPHILQK